MDLKKQLANLNISKLKMKNGLSVGDNLRVEAERLYKCIQKYINAYYDSYEPDMYERTYRFQDAMFAKDFIDIAINPKGCTLSLSIKFNESLSNHPSVLGDDDGYVPLLINDGWCWDNYTGKEDHFRRYDGFHFIEKGIDEWNKTNKFGFVVTVNKTYNGNTIQNSIYR